MAEEAELDFTESCGRHHVTHSHLRRTAWNKDILMNGLDQDRLLIVSIFHIKMLYIWSILKPQPGHVKSHHTTTNVFDSYDYIDTR